MDSMIFWRLCPGKKIVNSITCWYFAKGHSLVLHIFTVYNFTCNYGICFIRMVPFFSMGAHHRSKLSFSREWVWELTVYHFSPSWNWEIIFSLSNNYKPILSVGEGKNLINAILANSHKYNCHDMNWNDMDI